MNLEDTMLSEKSVSQKDLYMVPGMVKSFKTEVQQWTARAEGVEVCMQ